MGFENGELWRRWREEEGGVDIEGSRRYFVIVGEFNVVFYDCYIMSVWDGD